MNLAIIFINPTSNNQTFARLSKQTKTILQFYFYIYICILASARAFVRVKFDICIMPREPYIFPG